MKRGISVTCTTCGRAKAPHGRSIPDSLGSSLCSEGCPGYSLEPFAGCLWPGETDADFGFAVCGNATEKVDA